MHIETVQIYEEKLRGYINKRHFKNVIIYGAGVAGKYLYSLLNDEINIVFFIDEFVNERFYIDIPIFKLTEVNEPKADAIIIAVLTKNQSEIVENLLKCKYPFCNIVNIQRVIARFLKKQINETIKEKKGIGRSVKLIVGAGSDANEEVYLENGWISTDIYTLDITKERDWAYYFKQIKVNAVLAEHVLEHLSNEEAQNAVTNCYKYLDQQGYIRLAVPDGFHPDPNYIDQVKPGGKGEGSDEHKVLYNYQTISLLLKNAGFKLIVPLEYFDEKGEFHRSEWSIEKGFIKRSFRFDNRNFDYMPNYTSLIIDAFKCGDEKEKGNNGSGSKSFPGELIVNKGNESEDKLKIT